VRGKCQTKEYWTWQHIFCSVLQDHDSHGPEFLKHMYRLNKLTGANITVRL